MLVPEAPWWNLNTTPLAFGEQDGVFLQYPEAIPQCGLLKWSLRKLQVLEDPRNMVKGYVQCNTPFGKLTPKTCRMCSVWLTSNWFQSVYVSAPCIHYLCAIINHEVRYNPKYGIGISLLSRSRYFAPLYMHRCPAPSFNILEQSVTSWHVIALYFAKISNRLYRRNDPISMFRAPQSHSRSCDPITTLSENKSPRNPPTASPSTYWETSWFFTDIAS